MSEKLFNGMNAEPMVGYDLASRFVCDKCGTPPQIVSADGNSTVTVKVRCHGETEMITVSKKELTFTQHVFKQPE